MEEKMDNAETSLVTLSSFAVIVPSSMRIHDPYPDYNMYFEPVSDTTRRIPAHTENVADSSPDFSDYFEPVASNTQFLRVNW